MSQAPKSRKSVSIVSITVGSKVRKLKGYKWPGIVVAIFKTLAGETRIVVECTVPDVAGALHIYSPEQLTEIA